MVSRLRRVSIWLSMILLTIAPASLHAQGAATPEAITWESDWPMSPAFLKAAEAPPDPDMARYLIDVALDSAAGTIGGSLQVDFTNHTGTVLTELPFRLFPNGAYYLEGGTTVANVNVDGASAGTDLAVADTVLFVMLDDPLLPGEATTVTLDFVTVVPADSSGSFGIFSRDVERKTWILSDWYPIVTGWDSTTGWGLDPPSIWGDPTFADASVYSVDLTVPSGMSVVATGDETLVNSASDADTYTVRTGPVRDFTLVLDDRFAEQRSLSENTEIGLYLDQSTTPNGADGLLQHAQATLRSLSELLGPYPYAELDIVQTELAGALGVSWSGVLFINAAALDGDLAGAGTPGDRLTFILTHEIGHQWWGGMLGVNSNDHAFMNESLANYSSVLVYDDIFGKSSGTDLLVNSIAAPYLAYLTDQPDGVVDRPVGEISSAGEFGALIYGKGSLGFHAILLETGSDAFVVGMADYSSSFAFQIGDPDDLLAALEASSGRQLDELWSNWFESADTTAADVEQLLIAS